MSGQDYRVPSLNRRDIRTLTHQIRSMLSITNLHFPIMEFVEFGLPSLIDDYELSIMPIEDMPGTHGLTIPQESKIILREDIYEGALNGNGRDRMTVAHELGHLLMHKNISFARSMPNVRIRAFESSEWQAKCFSGELLIPANKREILLNMTPIEVAQVCGVSLEAAEYQLQKI